MADLRRLKDIASERERASPRAREPASEIGRSRELIVPFGGTGYIFLFEIVADEVVVGAVRHQREEDYRR